MFNVSTCCGITLASVLPLWERRCSFLLLLLGLPLLSVSLLAAAHARGAGSRLRLTNGTVARLWPLGARCVYCELMKQISIRWNHPWGSPLNTAKNCYLDKSRHCSPSLFRTQEDGCSERKKTTVESSRCAVTLNHFFPHTISIHCVLFFCYLSKSFSHLLSTDAHTSSFAVRCWRWVLVENSGGNAVQRGASWVDVPGWWPSHPSFPSSTGLLFVMCLFPQCVPS